MAVSPAPRSAPSGEDEVAPACVRVAALRSPLPSRPATACRALGRRPRPAATDADSTADGWRTLVVGGTSTRVSALRGVGGGGGGGDASEGSVLGASPSGGRKRPLPPYPVSAVAGQCGSGGGDSDGSVGAPPVPRRRRREVGSGVVTTPTRVLMVTPGAEAGAEAAEGGGGGAEAGTRAVWPSNVCPVVAATLAGTPVPGLVVMQVGVGTGDGVGPDGRGFEE